MGLGKFPPSLHPNLKDDLLMGTRKLTPEDLERITQAAREWGKIVVRRAYGDEGPDLDVDLAQMEQVGQAAMRGLLAGTLEQATSQQAQRLGNEQPCPTCGRSCPVKTVVRPIDVSGGT